MLADVVDASTAAGVAPHVLSPDPEVLRFAEQTGARAVMDDEEATSLNEALEHALAACATEAALVLLPDTPLVTAHELRALLSIESMGGELGHIVAVPDQIEHGTNALFLRPPTVVPLRFGRNSLKRHLQAAEDRGVSCSVYRYPGLALDIDRPEDLRAFVAEPSHTRSYELLAQLGKV